MRTAGRSRRAARRPRHRTTQSRLDEKRRSKENRTRSCTRGTPDATVPGARRCHAARVLAWGRGPSLGHTRQTRASRLGLRRAASHCTRLYEKPKALPAALCTARPMEAFMPDRATSPATPAPILERTSCLQRTYPMILAQLSETAAMIRSSQSNLKLKKHPT